jgi:predicted dienelactone hydrolase
MQTKKVLRLSMQCALVVLGCVALLQATRTSANQEVDSATHTAALDTPGPYKVGIQTVTITRDDQTTFDALLYYPATAAGSNTSFDGSGGPYPAITFGHGAMMDATYYQSTLQHLASYGYFVIATQSYSSFSMDPIPADKFAADLRSGLTYLEQQNASSGSPFHGKVDTGAFGALGHSAGGHAAIQAAADDTRIKTLAGLAPDGTTAPSAITTVKDVHVPYRILAGSCDGITPVSDHAQPVYNNANAPKQLAVITGGYHNGFTDRSMIPGMDFPPENCPANVTKLTRDAQLKITRQWLTTWFNYYLKKDTSLQPDVWGPGLTADPLVVVQYENGIPLELKNKTYLPVITN